jgi:uncharacterized membrane protein HdeD (DUF308 family)
MGIGTSVFLIAAGAILSNAIEVDVPYVDDDTLGLILMIAGIITLVFSVVMKRERPEAGIGTGVVLVGAGAVLAWAIDFDLPFIADYLFGTILMVAGLVAIVATLLMSRQRRQPGYDYAQQGGYQQGGYQPGPRGYGR